MLTLLELSFARRHCVKLYGYLDMRREELEKIWCFSGMEIVVNAMVVSDQIGTFIDVRDLQ